MILAPSAYSVSLVAAGITYNKTLGFWESATSLTGIGNYPIGAGFYIHDYAVFGKLSYTSTPGSYPTGYNPDLFYYGFLYSHYTPVAIGSAPSYIFRFGLASTLEDAMNRTPIIFSDGGSGNLQFKTNGKFIKLVTTVPECCDLPYFNEDQPLLQLYPGSSSFDPESLNDYDFKYNDAVVQNSQIRHDKIKKSVSFTCGVTRNSLPVDNSAPAGYSLIHTESEISEVVSWLSQEQVLYLHSDQDFTLGKNFQSTVKKTYYAKQVKTTAGSVRIYPGHLGYANGRRKTRSVNLLYYPFTEYFVENQLLVFNFSVDFGDPSGFIPYTPGPDKIVYTLSITGQFHQYGDYEQQKTISITYKLTEDFDLINLGHLSGSKVLTLVPITSSQMGYAPNYYINIPSTVTVTFSGDDYSAEVLPASLTLVSPEKYLQDPCRVAVVSTTGVYSAPSGLGVVDGITLVAGDRVLLVITSSYLSYPSGGVWIASAGTWTRPAGYNVRHSYYEILEGTNAGKKYFLSNSAGTVYSQFGVFPSEHNWRVNNYTDELPSSITLTKVAGYNNYESEEFTTAVNVKNYIRLKLVGKGPNGDQIFYGAESYYGFSFQQWTPDRTLGVYGSLYQDSEANIVFYNKAVHVADAEADGSLFYPAPATVKMLSSYSGLITIRLFKMAGMTNGSTGSSENSITVQYLLDWPLDITPTPPPS
jgi:hypothetical protein